MGKKVVKLYVPGKGYVTATVGVPDRFGRTETIDPSEPQTRIAEVTCTTGDEKVPRKRRTFRGNLRGAAAMAALAREQQKKQAIVE